VSAASLSQRARRCSSRAYRLPSIRSCVFASFASAMIFVLIFLPPADRDGAGVTKRRRLRTSWAPLGSTAIAVSVRWDRWFGTRMAPMGPCCLRVALAAAVFGACDAQRRVCGANAIVWLGLRLLRGLRRPDVSGTHSQTRTAAARCRGGRCSSSHCRCWRNKNNEGHTLQHAQTIARTCAAIPLGTGPAWLSRRPL